MSNHSLPTLFSVSLGSGWWNSFLLRQILKKKIDETHHLRRISVFWVVSWLLICYQPIPYIGSNIVPSWQSINKGQLFHWLIDIFGLSIYEIQWLQCSAPCRKQSCNIKNASASVRILLISRDRKPIQIVLIFFFHIPGKIRKQQRFKLL